ncbi:methyltransferase domain-containing protein [Peribacillus frigoritolerans]|nr:methyltransferase domain-containing protein [Peribacillus frigoritolerans]
MTDYIELRKQAMTDHTGKMPNRLKDDAAEEAFWGFQGCSEKNNTKRTLMQKIVQQELLALLKQDDHVLEIGPGWGNYTFDIAKEVRKLTCIDSSKSIISFLESQANEKGFENMELIHDKWESDNKKVKYDVVFGFNCYYRMSEIGHTLLKMNDSAARLAIVGMTTGPEKTSLYGIEATRIYD